MKYLSTLFLLFPLILFPLISWAAAPSVEMQLETTDLTEDMSVELSVVVKGLKDASEPSFENNSEVNLQSRGSSSQIQIINGSMSSSIVYQYVLNPKHSGTITFGPAFVVVDGKKYASQPLQLQVHKEQQSAHKTDEKSYFYVEADVTQKSLYVGQQTVYTFRFFNRAQIANAQIEQFPSFQGLVKEEIEKQKKYSINQNGIAWDVTEIKVALFPTSSGLLKIDPAVVSLQAITDSPGRRRSQFDSIFEDGFFGGRRNVKEFHLRTKPIEIQVKSLPENKPASFSGAVGYLQVHANLSKTDLKVGQSATLTLKLEGNANIRDVQLPAINWPDVKIYDDQPVVDIKTDGKQIVGSKTFKRAIVPIREGKLELPSIEVAYFNPDTNQFVNSKTSPIILNVQPGNPEDTKTNFTSGNDNAKQKLKVIGEDIQPIKYTFTANQHLSQMTQTWFLIYLGLLPFIYIFGYFLKDRKDNLRIGDIRKQRALKTFTAAIKKLPQDDKFYTQLSILFRTYLGDILNVDGKALSSVDIERLFTNAYTDKTLRNRLSPNHIITIKRLMNDFEMSEFGGATFLGSDKTAKLEEILSLVKQIEKET